MAGSWDRPGRDCPGVDGTTALLTMTVQSLHLYCQSGWHDSCGVGAYVPAFRPVIPQSADIAIAGATAKGSGNSLLIHFSPLQDWLPRSHYILNGLKTRRRKALYRLAIELLQGDFAPLLEGAVLSRFVSCFACVSRPAGPGARAVRDASGTTRRESRRGRRQCS